MFVLIVELNGGESVCKNNEEKFAFEAVRVFTLLIEVREEKVC